MNEKRSPRRLRALRIPAGWSIVWNELYETHGSDSEDSLLMVRRDPWFLDVTWHPARKYWLRVIKTDSQVDSDPWNKPLFEFQTGSLDELSSEVERILDRGIY